MDVSRSNPITDVIPGLATAADEHISVYTVANGVRPVVTTDKADFTSLIDLPAEESEGGGTQESHPRGCGCASCRDDGPARELSGRVATSSSAGGHRSFVLWSGVEQRKARETVQWQSLQAGTPTAAGPFEALMQDLEARLLTDPVLAAAEQEIQKDIKRTFPLLPGYASREVATRNVLLAFAHRNPRVGYCQSLNFVAGALLLSDLSEQDAFFSLCTLVEDVMPADYYSQELHILG